MGRQYKFKFKFKFKCKNIIHSINSYLVFSFFLFFLSSCSNDKIINQDKLVLIYSDLLIAQDTVSLSKEGLDSLRQSVFRKYKVNEEEYKITINYYNEDIKRWEDFFDKVTAHISSLKAKTD